MTTTTTAAKPSSGLRAYLITRVLLVIPMVWILVTLVFFVMRVVGDPIEAAFGGKVTPQDLANRRHAAGLDRPLLTQYWDYLTGIVHFDFGKSQKNEEISTVVLQKGAATLELTFYAVLVALVVAVPLGRLAARYRDRLPDVTIRLFAVLAYAMPVFFLGLLFKLLFAVKLGWLPASRQASPDVKAILDNQVVPDTHIYLLNAILYGDGSYIRDVLEHAVLPALTLGLYAAGIFTRLIRVNLLQTLRADYVEAARARGVKERWVMRRHALRNAMIPVFTAIGLQIAGLLSGSVLTETTFEWQGLGFAVAQYLRSVDFIAVQGIVAAIAVIVALISLVIDVVAAVVDPRVRY